VTGGGTLVVEVVVVEVVAVLVEVLVVALGIVVAGGTVVSLTVSDISEPNNCSVVRTATVDGTKKSSSKSPG
jgi:hypothetical protein